MSADNLRKLPWNIQVSHHNGNVIVYGPELKIIGKGKTLSEAITQFETQQQQYFNEMVSNGLAEQIPDPRIQRKRANTVRKMGLFWAKHFVLALFYALVFIGAGRIVGQQIGKGVNQVNKEWNTFTAEDGNADKAKRLENFREDVSRLTPFMKELRKAWKESEQ